jgi:hypothetical protein
VVSGRFYQLIKGNKMNKIAIAFALCTSFVFSPSAIAQQGRNFDESGASWIQKTDMAMKGESKTSAQIRAEANQFLRFNKWDVGSSKFIPVTGEPRVMSKLTREEQNMEISMFAKTHMYDTFSGAWVDKATGAKMVMPSMKQ